MSRRKNDLSQRLEAVIKTLVPQQEQNPDDLGPMMRAIKAVHSISDHTSTTPEDLERQRAAVCLQRTALPICTAVLGRENLRVLGAFATQTEAVAQEIFADFIAFDCARRLSAGLAAQTGRAAAGQIPLQLRFQIQFVGIDQHEAEFRLLLLPCSVLQHVRADCLHAERIVAVLALRADLQGNAAAFVRRCKCAVVFRNLYVGNLGIDRVEAAQLQLIAQLSIGQLRSAHVLPHGRIRRAE